jgi:hypothetical protein
MRRRNCVLHKELTIFNAIILGPFEGVGLA